MLSISRRSCLISSLAGFPAIRRARAAATPVTAETAYGKVRGLSVKGVDIFRGIPYGGPSEGTARFLPPSKPAQWSGVRDAVVTGPRCVQGPGNNLPGSGNWGILRRRAAGQSGTRAADR